MSKLLIDSVFRLYKVVEVIPPLYPVKITVFPISNKNQLKRLKILSPNHVHLTLKGPEYFIVFVQYIQLPTYMCVCHS